MNANTPTKDLSDVAIGDVVLYHSGYGSSIWTKQMVTGKTAGGKLDVNGSRFDSKTGREWGVTGKYRYAYVAVFDQSVLDEQDAKAKLEQDKRDLSRDLEVLASRVRHTSRESVDAIRAAIAAYLAP
jgi:hypothetical protein